MILYSNETSYQISRLLKLLVICLFQVRRNSAAKFLVFMSDTSCSTEFSILNELSTYTSVTTFMNKDTAVHVYENIVIPCPYPNGVTTSANKLSSATYDVAIGPSRTDQCTFFYNWVVSTNKQHLIWHLCNENVANNLVHNVKTSETTFFNVILKVLTYIKWGHILVIYDSAVEWEQRAYTLTYQLRSLNFTTVISIGSNATNALKSLPFQPQGDYDFLIL